LFNTFVVLSRGLCPKDPIGIIILAMVNIILIRMRTFSVLLILAASSFAAGAVTLNVDPAQSQITLSGTVAGFKLAEQGSGSLTTTVGGSINLTVADGQIQIDSANLDPNTNGSWKPGRNGADSSPADLAGQSSSFVGTITGALRDLVVNAVSTAKSLDSNGKFDASSIVFAFPQNSSSILDYNAGFLGTGSKALAGAGTNQTATVGTLVSNNGVQTLTIALDATFTFTLLTANDTEMTLKGQLVATGGAAPVNPTITDVQLKDGKFQFTAGNTTANTQVQTSTTLTSWAPQQATITANDATTRTFVIPSTEKFQFFRLTQ
jgi:hypothetical protein